MFVACATRTMAGARRLASEERERKARQGLFPPYHLIFARIEDGYKRLGDRQSIKAIIAEVAERHDVTPGDIIGPCRSRHLVAARHEAMWEARTRRPDLSLPTLGRLFKRDHTSVLHATRRHERRLAEAR